MRWLKWLAILCVAMLAPLSERAVRAQDQAQIIAPGSGLGRPSIPPRGDWLQVLTVTDKWLVLENERGQQFPVSFDAVNQFVMRWPTTVQGIGPADLVEVTGITLGSTKIVSDHVDVFKGAARNLVTPTVQFLLGFNRVMTMFDVERQNTLGYNYQYALTPFEMQMPTRYHVVSNAVNLDPLMVSIGANNSVQVVPSTNGFDMTEVTAGAPSFVLPGDLAYVVPLLAQTTPRTMVLAQLVIFKSMPSDAFAR